jgi:hypothetical protein
MRPVSERLGSGETTALAQAGEGAYNKLQAQWDWAGSALGSAWQQLSTDPIGALRQGTGAVLSFAGNAVYDTALFTSDQIAVSANLLSGGLIPATDALQRNVDRTESFFGGVYNIEQAIDSKDYALAGGLAVAGLEETLVTLITRGRGGQLVDGPSKYTHSAPYSGNPLEPNFVGPVNSATGQAERYLFRGDDRSPEMVFKEGFQPLGNNTDLHLYASENVPSIYVGTSRSPNVARDYASDEGFVFTIRGQSQGIDVNGVLGTRSPFPDDLEIAVPGGIKSGDILGGRKVDPNTGKFTGPFIYNPNFEK